MPSKHSLDDKLPHVTSAGGLFAGFICKADGLIDPYVCRKLFRKTLPLPEIYDFANSYV